MSNSTFIKTALCVAVLAGQGSVWARCADDLAGDSKPEKATSKPGSKAVSKAGGAAGNAAGNSAGNAKTDTFEAEPAYTDPMQQLQFTAREAARRSASVGAARLLAEAAALDVKETEAGRWPQVSVSGNLGSGGSKQDNTTVTSGNQSSVSLNVSAPLWDGGRISNLTDYRAQLAG